MPKTATPANVKVDPQLVGLLIYMLGSSVNRKAYAETIAAAVQGARDLLNSEPLTTAFDDYADRPSTYELVSQAVERNLLGKTDPSCRDEHRQVVQMLRAVNHDDGSLGIEDSSTSHYVLLQYAEEGMLLGAALMYEMLKGRAGK